MYCSVTLPCDIRSVWWSGIKSTLKERTAPPARKTLLPLSTPTPSPPPLGLPKDVFQLFPELCFLFNPPLTDVYIISCSSILADASSLSLGSIWRPNMAKLKYQIFLTCWSEEYQWAVLLVSFVCFSLGFLGMLSCCCHKRENSHRPFPSLPSSPSQRFLSTTKNHLCRQHIVLTSQPWCLFLLKVFEGKCWPLTL